MNTGDVIAGKRKKRRIRKEFIVILSLILLIIFIYFIGSIYFSDKFLRGTYINALDVSGLTIDEANKELAKTIDDYTLELRFRDGNVEQLSGEDLQVKYNENNNVKDVLEKQNSFEWIQAFFSKQSHTVNNLALVDENVLKEKLASLQHLQTAAQIPPEDAKIEYVDNKFVIKNEVMGSTIDLEKASQAIILAFSEGSKVLDLDKSKCYVEPNVKASDELIQQQCQAANQYASAIITYKTRSGDVVLDGNELITWLSIDETGKYYRDDSVFKKKATEFVSSLAKK